jgi:hypothetical protein
VQSLPGGVFNNSMIPYAPASLDNTQPGYSLTKRIRETDPRITIAPRIGSSPTATAPATLSRARRTPPRSA